jgi:ABC-type transporter Mla MlaB component
MLRITNKMEGRRTLLVLEGRLVGEWVEVLNEECTAQIKKGRALSLDFSGLTFVDQDGIALLRQLKELNTSFIECPAFVAALCRTRGDGHAEGHSGNDRSRNLRQADDGRPRTGIKRGSAG